MGVLIKKDFSLDRKIFLASFAQRAYNTNRQKKSPEHREKFGVGATYTLRGL
jgi:hypothetical protein